MFNTKKIFKILLAINIGLVLGVIINFICDGFYEAPLVELKSFSVNITDKDDTDDFFDIDATGVFEIRSDKYIIAVLIFANKLLLIQAWFHLKKLEEEEEENEVDFSESKENLKPLLVVV